MSYVTVCLTYAAGGKKDSKDLQAVQSRKRENRTHLEITSESKDENKNGTGGGGDEANVQSEAWTLLVMDTLKEPPRIDVGGFAREFEKL